MTNKTSRGEPELLCLGALFTLDDLGKADERTLRFAPLGLSTQGLLAPRAAVEFNRHLFLGVEFGPDVPAGVRSSFERLRLLHIYGVLQYDFFSITRAMCWMC